MSKHTPGPYLREDRFVYAATPYIMPSGGEVAVNRFSASVSPGHECPPEEAEAVARLFEAAPDLLEALRVYEAAWSDMFTACLSNGVFNAWGGQINCTNLNEAHRLAESAIAKATGRPA